MYDLTAIFAKVTENECINEKQHFVKGTNLTKYYCAVPVTGKRYEIVCKLVSFTNRSRTQAFSWYQNK